MITFSKFGNYGRLGNQLFQYASMIGIAEQHGTTVVLPRWDVADYFETPPTIAQVTPTMTFNEPHFHYTPIAIDPTEITDITGWLQSEKYWEHCKDKVKQLLTLKQSKVNGFYEYNKKFFGKQSIAISIRRGDYVNNPNYELLNADYYYLALLEHFPDWRDYNILIFSDDIPYCKVHFECMPNVHFIEGFNPIEQLIIGSLCDHFIIANSTFSWWMAYLGEKEHSKIIRPAYLFNGELLRTSDSKDFYPDRWIKFDHKGKKLEMRDVTIVMPVSIDSRDREENKQIVTHNLNSLLNTYIFTGDPMHNSKFHRTRWLNERTKRSGTTIVINYDCDILVPPFQLWLAVEQLRRGEADMVYPYDGRFARVPRSWVGTIRQYNDTGMFRDTEFVGCRKGDSPSVGGVVAYRKDKFAESGGENEKMVSYAPEDVERYYRWNKLGYKVSRIKGCCYHIDHVITTNSSTTHPDYKANEAELAKVKSMSESELRNYVNSWNYL